MPGSETSVVSHLLQVTTLYITQPTDEAELGSNSETPHVHTRRLFAARTCTSASACGKCIAAGNTAKKCTTFGLDCACAQTARPTNTPTMTPTDLPTIAPREHVACAAGSPCAKCMATGNTATQCASYGVECACAQPPKHVACAAGSACTRCMASGNTAKQCTSYGLDCACARGAPMPTQPPSPRPTRRPSATPTSAGPACGDSATVSIVEDIIGQYCSGQDCSTYTCDAVQQMGYCTIGPGNDPYIYGLVSEHCGRTCHLCGAN